MIKVVIADDQPLIRDGLKYIIEQDNEISVAGCAANGTEAFQLCEKFMPDVVLMDIGMPDCDGIEGTRLIKEKFKAIKIVILTTFKDSGSVVRALEMGADGYILKDIDTEKLIISIKGTAKGLRVIHEEAFTEYVSGIKEEKDKGSEKSGYKLSEREIEIIRLIVYGNSNKEIAANLQLTEGVVRNIISGLLGKLNLQDRTQLAVFSIKHKIV